MRRMLCALTAALLSVPVTHASVLDQSQSTITAGSYFAVGATTPAVQSVIGQVFTAGLDGYIERVQVYVENSSASPVTGGLLLSVQTVTPEGLPSGRELTSDSIGVCSATLVTRCVPPAGSPGWVEFNLPPARVDAGTRYALVLRAWGGGYLRWYNRVGPSFYPNGYAAGTTGGGWFAIDYDDTTFQTYVRPPALDQSQTAVDSFKFVTPQHAMAQIFVPAVTGYLRRIRVLLENDNATSPIRVTIHIRDLESPTIFTLGPALAVATIPVASVPPAGNPGWVDVTFDYLWLVAGTQYSIELSVPATGSTKWFDHYAGMSHTRRWELYWEYFHGMGYWENYYVTDATFETYMLQPAMRSTSPPPRVISPCINRVCPETKGGLTPADYVDGIKAHFLFKEKLDGVVMGTFSFRDEWPDGISFEDCTTEPGPCQLQVTTFQCTGPNAMTVAGGLRRAGDTYATSYELNLVGSSKGPGTITLKTPKNTYTVTRDRIVEVRCP